MMHYIKHFVTIDYALDRFYNSNSQELYSSHFDSPLSNEEQNIERLRNLNKFNKLQKNSELLEKNLHNKDF